MNTPQFQFEAKDGIGAQLEQIRLTLLQTCDHLEDGIDEAVKARVDKIRSGLENYVANVSIVGQVKAGKSSLVNSLTRRTDLMPTDINPWTSVVTRLFFGHPSGQTSGGTFWFFDDAHWERLATRGGLLGELTGDLLEDYKRDQLHDQVRAMRDRASLRLGDKFEKLLGKRHRFETITKEIMERYVCAGDAPKERLKNPQAGRYADITHTAEIYFEKSPFGCPICITDTPGTNDPLLIREEITQQSIENAEFFVFVLSAHQALSESDLKLLRVMKALNRDQLVVFVNRIDEVDNLVGVKDKLLNQIKQRLRQELGSEVPVILGSAAWADFALCGHDDDVEHDLVETIASKKSNITADVSASYSLDQDKRRENALIASGLLDLEQALSEVILNGAVGSVFRQAVDELQVLMQQTITGTRLRINELTPSEAGSDVSLTSAERDTISEYLLSNLQETERKILAINQTQWNDLQEDLETAASQLKMALSADDKRLKGAKAAKAMSEDVDALRETLKNTYLDEFTRIQELLWGALKDIKAYRNVKAPEGVRDELSRLTLGTIGLLSVSPNAMAIYRPVLLDLSAGWLGSLFGRGDEKLRVAITMVEDHFLNVSKELSTDGKDSFEAFVKFTLSSYRDDLRRLLEELTEGESMVANASVEGLDKARLQLLVSRLIKDSEILSGLEAYFQPQQQLKHA